MIIKPMSCIALVFILLSLFLGSKLLLGSGLTLAVLEIQRIFSLWIGLHPGFLRKKVKQIATKLFAFLGKSNVY